ncbi:MAG TPA: putative LPS assembly protein LptD, partial [Longimicrobiaceae bacterium]|nr:putative LPS assembly protein LptD [Longimicrobiaceae bacterium]
MPRLPMSRTLGCALGVAAALASLAAARQGASLAPVRASAAYVGGLLALRDTIPPRVRPAADTGRARAAADTTRPSSAAPQEPDSVYEQLLRLEGYAPVQYRGEEAEFLADSGRLKLRGSAEVERGGEKLTADSIIYYERSQLAAAFGNPKASGGGQNIEGERLLYDLERRVAAVEGGRTTYQSGATWYVVGERVAAEQETNRLFAEGTTFTSDERPEPSYHFRAGKVKVVRDRLLVGRPAVLYFRNVPVAWLPFIVQDMERGRRSGILTPRFGINDIVRTSSGYQRQISNVGYYWAINPYLGAQLSGEWRSNSYTALLGNLDFNWRRQFLNGSFGYREFFPEDGPHQRTLSGNASWRPNERTNINAQGSWASSSQYIRQRSTDPFEATQDLQSSFSLDRRFNWGQLNLGAQARQSLGNDRVEYTFPSLGITPNTITLFRSGSPETARWYNDVTVTLGFQASRTGVTFPADTAVTLRVDTTFTDAGDTIFTPRPSVRVNSRPENRTNLALNNSFRVGNLSLTNSASFNRNIIERLRNIDPDSIGTFDRDEGQWSSAISYQQNLIGSTFISPNLSLSQQFRRDTLSRKFSGDEYVTAPMRVNFGASLNTDLYGFFPGFGPFERIRHHIKPIINYSYSPRVVQTSLQDTVFGRFNARTQNRVSFGLDQTFEAKLRSPAPVQQRDTTADTARAGQAAAPQDARKVTVLALNTSPLEFDFERAFGTDTTTDGAVVRRSWRDALVSDQISGTLRSDYLQGLNLNFAFDLFGDASTDDARRDPLARGGFAPQLSSLSTSFSFGQGSAFFRWLGLGGRRTDRSMVPGGQQLVPGDSVRTPASPIGSTTGTDNPQRAGGRGPWNVSLNYALVRARESAATRGVPGFGGNSQTLNATVAFFPTPNWSVNWNTSYDITSGDFGAHRLNLRRDLYRWEANFDFYRTPVGNTSFEFSVHLKDLPDLKVDYRERDIGVDQRR